MKTEQTPKTWRAVAWSSHAKTTVVEVQPDGRYQVIAECGNTGARENQAADEEQKALLIAAVPELLAALALQSQALERICLGGESPSDVVDDGLISTVNAAIAKAGALAA